MTVIIEPTRIIVELELARDARGLDELARMLLPALARMMEAGMPAPVPEEEAAPPQRVCRDHGIVVDACPFCPTATGAQAA